LALERLDKEYEQLLIKYAAKAEDWTRRLQVLERKSEYILDRSFVHGQVNKPTENGANDSADSAMSE